jgi:hypothetical protein
VYPATDAGREWGDPVVRDPVTVRIRGRGRPVLAAAGDSDPERNADADPDRRVDTDTRADTGADAGTDTTADAGTDTRADADPDRTLTSRTRHGAGAG